MKAQRTCLIRAKNIMSLSYATLRGPSVYASLDVCSILLFSMRTYSAPTVVEDYHDSAYNACCTIHCSNLPANDWTAKNADPNHRGILSQIIMQTHCLYLFIMLRGYRDSFQIAGAKTATQQIRNRLGAPTRNVSSSGAWPDCEEQELASLALRGNFALVFTRVQSQNT